MLVGEIYALFSAFCWAVGGIALKRPSTILPSLYLGMWRNLAAWVLIFIFTISLGLVNQLLEIPIKSIVYIILSGLIGLTFGSTLYIKALSHINVSLAYPICNSSWITFVGLAAYLFLGESFTLDMLIGAILIITGLSFLTQEKSQPEKGKSKLPIGFIYALLAGTCWAMASVFLKLGISDVHPFLVNFIRLPVAILPLIIFAYRRPLPKINHVLKKQLLWQTSISGILDQFLAAYFFFTAIQQIGVAKTSILGITSPLFVAPLSILILKEKITWKVALGTILCVIGAWLTI